MNQSKKIKVVIGINDFLVGGAQKLIVNQLRFFDRERYDIRLVTLRNFPERVNLLNQIPSDVPVYALNFKRYFDIVEYGNLFRELWKQKPDIVVSHLFFSNTVFRLLKPFVGYNVIIVEHNTYIHRTRIEICIDKLLSYFTYKIVAVSQTVADFASRQEGIARVRFDVIHNGVDISEIESCRRDRNVISTRSNLGIDISTKLALNVGRLTTQKNHDLLIESFAEFSKENSEFKLFILGEGELRWKLEEKVDKLGARDRIFFLGAKENIYDYYLASDFMLSTSAIEGLSLAYLEAQAFGLPIVATRTAGTDEIVEDGVNGFFVEASVESVIAGLRKIATADAQKLKQNSFLAIRRFDISVNAEKYEKLIEECVRGQHLRVDNAASL